MARELEASDLGSDVIDETADDALEPSVKDLADDAFGIDDHAQIIDDEPDGEEETIEGDLDALEDDPADKETVADPDATGQPRDASGKFVPKAEAKTETADTSTTAPAKPADALVETAAATQPTWEPLVVRVDKAMVPIDEAQVTRTKDAAGQGYHVITVKDEVFPQFHTRLARAHLFERNRQAIESDRNTLAAGIKELETLKAAPQPKSDSEIEAEMTLAAIKPLLDQILEPKDVELLEARIKLAQREHREQHTKDTESFFTKKAEEAKAAEQPAADDAFQYEGLSKEILDVLKNTPELADLTPDQLKAAYTDLTKIMRAVFWKESDGWYANRELIVDTLRAKRANAAPPAEGHTAASTGTSAASQGSTQDPKATKDADRFNKGQATSAAPTTTSLKANRDATANSRPRVERNTRKEPVKSAEMVAEDEWNADKKSFLRSNTLDW